MVEKRLLMRTSLETSQVAMLVQNANAYKSEIHITSAGKVANLKSIMGVISLGMLDGIEISITGDGDDEAAAVEFVYNFLAKLI